MQCLKSQSGFHGDLLPYSSSSIVPKVSAHTAPVHTNNWPPSSHLDEFEELKKIPRNQAHCPLRSQFNRHVVRLMRGGVCKMQFMCTYILAWTMDARGLQPR